MSKVFDLIIKENTDMKRFLEKFNFDGQGAIIKPNWTSADYGFHTDSESLELLLSNIKGKKYVIESYMYGRTDGSRKINSANGLENWEWLKEQDERFLEFSGMCKLFEKYDVEYINITEEWWSGRSVEAGEIQKIVEGKYKAIYHRELYGTVPEKLFGLKHLPLISYSKFKYNLPVVSNFSSFSMKNLFGLIPVPNREYYHGSDFDTGLSRSIVDIVTIYKALFRVIGMCEGVYRIPVTREKGSNKYKMLWTEYDLIENSGIILGSEDIVTLDAYANKLAGLNPDARTILKLGEEVFGKWDRDELNYITEEKMKAFK